VLINKILTGDFTMKTSSQYVTRDLETDIRSCLELPEIIAVTGARQCGKTTLLNKIISELASQEVSAIDFEDRQELLLFQNDIKAFAELHVKEKKYLFIDEFQYATDGGRLLKFIYDNFPVKIFITGSSSTELSVQSIQYLVGRIFVFMLYPFSFNEFLRFKNSRVASFLSETESLSDEVILRTNKYYNEYALYGGYPQVVLAGNDRERELVLKNIYNTYLLKEIRQILNYPSDTKLEKLIQALALQISSSCNYNELSNLTGFRYNDLIKALDILSYTFVIAPCQPFYTNKRLELIKTPKFYFVDNGFRNAVLKNFSPLSTRNDSGAIHENFIAAELLKKEFALRYWRTKSRAKVDFILESQGNQVPVEVKATLKKPAITKSFRSFLKKYKPPQAFVASKNLYANKIIADTPVYFRPLWATIQTR
jgi:hypothetical protein